MERFFKDNIIWEVFYSKIFMQVGYFVVWFFYCFIQNVREKFISVEDDDDDKSGR